jgi:hypothetical protein
MLGKLLRHLSLRGERQDSGEKPVDNYVERGQKSPISVKWKSDMAAYKSPDSSVKWMSSKAACKNPNDADILDVTGMIILAQDNEDLAVRRSSDRNANLDSQVSVQSYHTAHELPMPSTRSAQVPPSAGIGTIEEDYISRRRLERERSLGSTHTSTSSSPDHSSTASHRQMSSRPRTPLASGNAFYLISSLSQQH